MAGGHQDTIRLVPIEEGNECMFFCVGSSYSHVLRTNPKATWYTSRRNKRNGCRGRLYPCLHWPTVTRQFGGIGGLLFLQILCERKVARNPGKKQVVCERLSGENREPSHTSASSDMSKPEINGGSGAKQPLEKVEHSQRRILVSSSAPYLTITSQIAVGH